MAQVLSRLPKPTDPNLLVGTDHFDDAGVYRLDDSTALVMTVDFFPPLVNDPYTFGRIAAANSLSDIYAMGGRPLAALNIVGFPDKDLPVEILGEILRGGGERVAAAGAVVAGGHSVRDAEIKYGLSVTGIVHPDRVLINGGAKPGDVLVLTKPIGSGVLTSAAKAGKIAEDDLAEAIDVMIDLNAGACEAALEVGVHAATDITGFGLAGHAGEMAQSSEVTIALDIEKIPILPGAMELARQGNRTRASASNRDFAAPTTRVEGDPVALRVEFAYDAQTSGGLLISVAADNADDLIRHARHLGAETARVVGEVLARQDDCLVILRG